MRTWFEIRCSITHELEDSLVSFMIDLGATGCQVENNTLLAYFSEKVCTTHILNKIENYLKELLQLGFPVIPGQIKVRKIVEQDWNSEWKKYFKPIQISKHLYVKPTWEKWQAPKGAQVIEIDPGQAFGTGNHVTTRTMLQFLEKYLKPETLVLDVGTGTGILAIAAVKMSAKKVIALDIDPVAISTAKQNLQINRTENKINLLVGSVSCLKYKQNFDMILANLTGQAIISMIGDFANLLKPAGHLLISGILQVEMNSIIEKIQETRAFHLSEHKIEDDWVTFSFKRNFENEIQ